MDAVEAAQSGHPGTPMALAPAAWVLWNRFLRHDPADPAWPDRDRFVLSCGHASMLQYALLHLTGYDLPLEEIRDVPAVGVADAGHPERGHTPGVETTTGPLGQGVGNAVGMAIAERLLAERFNRPGLRDRGSSRLGVRERRRSDGRRGERGGVARRAPPARQAHADLRRQPHHHRRRHRAHLLRGRGPAFRGLRVARRARSPTATTSTASSPRLAPRARHDRSAVAGHPPHHHRRPRAHQAQHRRGARRAARRGRGTEDQGDHRLAGRAAVLRAARGAARDGGRVAERGAGAHAAWRERMARYAERHPERRGGVPPPARGRAASAMGARRCRSSGPSRDRSPPGRRRDSRSRRSPMPCPSSWAGRPTSAAAPARPSSRAGPSGPRPRAG